MTNLTADMLKSIVFYDEVSGLFYRRLKNGTLKQKPSGTICKNGYVILTILKKSYYAHRLAWLYCHSSFPDQHIDHINNIKTDNRLINLRDVNRSTNNRNIKHAKKNNKTKFLGVSYSGKKLPFRARIYLNGKQKQIGLFQTAEEAHQAYLKEKEKVISSSAQGWLIDGYQLG